MVYPFASAEAEHIALKLNTQSGCASWELLLYVFPQSLFRLTVTVAHVALSSRLSLGVLGLVMPCYRQGGGLNRIGLAVREAPGAELGGRRGFELSIARLCEARNSLAAALIAQRIIDADGQVESASLGVHLHAIAVHVLSSVMPRRTGAGWLGGQTLNAWVKAAQGIDTAERKGQADAFLPMPAPEGMEEWAYMFCVPAFGVLVFNSRSRLVVGRFFKHFIGPNVDYGPNVLCFHRLALQGVLTSSMRLSPSASEKSVLCAAGVGHLAWNQQQDE
ncbi:TPA: hypothetical protein ACKP38_004005 [Pseudomonas aeruginosa]